jgi:hypothetical protein
VPAAGRARPAGPWPEGARTPPARLTAHAARGLLVAACAALALTPAIAAPRASAQVAATDPASDVLFLRDVYYPFKPPVPSDQQAQLDTVVRELRRQGVSMKIALISGPSDLGRFTEYLGRPAAYNAYLARNLGGARGRIVLTVMHDGMAQLGANPVQAKALATVDPPKGGGGIALTRAALLAVTRMAEASQLTVRVPTRGGGEPPGGGSSSAWLALIPLLLGAVAGAVLIARRRLGGGRSS